MSMQCRVTLCPKRWPTPKPAPNYIFYSRPLNNLGSDYFLLLWLILWVHVAEDDEVS